jgi:hypothetical protein
LQGLLTRGGKGLPYQFELGYQWYMVRRRFLVGWMHFSPDLRLHAASENIWRHGEKSAHQVITFIWSLPKISSIL